MRPPTNPSDPPSTAGARDGLADAARPALWRRASTVALFAACLATTALSATVAHPARAAPQASPRAVDFELVAPRDHEHDGAGAGRDQHTSRVAAARIFRVAARRRFNLVGFRWRGDIRPRIRLQAFSRGRWSRWITVPIDPDHGPDEFANAGRLSDSDARRSPATASDPVWTGPARLIRYRIDRVPRDLRLHFVYARAGGRAIARRSDSGGMPAIVPRPAWAGSQCSPRVRPIKGEVLGAFVHHTVSTNRYEAADAASVVLGICRYHRNSNRWNEVGYNFLVDRFGTIYEGRSGGIDQPVIGAHAQGYNGQSTGIAMIGTYTAAQPSAPALDALRSLLSWKLALHGVTRDEPTAYISAGGGMNRYGAGKVVELSPISGHRDADSTACPGDALYAALTGLRSILAPSARDTTRVSIAFSGPRSIRPGGTVTLRGRLRSRAAGGAWATVAGAPVELQYWAGATGWTTAVSTTTGPDGRWRVTLTPPRGHLVRAVYGGSGDKRPIRSAERAFSVRVPRVKKRR